MSHCGATHYKEKKMLNTLQIPSTTTRTKPFYSQASWGRLEMKRHKKKIGTKQKRKRRKQRVIKNQIKKRRKDNKTPSQKSEKGAGKKLDKRQ
jgi:hypothetical protein